MAITTSDRTNNAVQSNSSRYTQGGVTDVFQNRLGWWERTILARQPDDIQWTIKSFEDRRPDLIAKNAYGRVSLAWLVRQYNNIVDDQTELRAGTVLVLPSQQRVALSISNKPVGGKPVT